MDIKKLLHPNTERPESFPRRCYLIAHKEGQLSTHEIFEWDERYDEFHGNHLTFIKLEDVFGWISLEELDNALFDKD